MTLNMQEAKRNNCDVNCPSICFWLLAKHNVTPLLRLLVGILKNNTDSPPINMGYWTLESENQLNVTTLANHCDCPINSDDILEVILVEFSLYFVSI